MSVNVKKTLILSVTSVKGGTGKTTNVLNLAGIYSNMKRRVLIIDLDLYSGDIAAILNIDNTKDIYNLFEDLTNNNFKNINDYITYYNEYIDVLSSPKDPRFASRINSKIISLILSKASTLYDVILIDTNHFLNTINLTAFDKSNEILYILNNDLMNLKNMKTMVSIFNNMGKSNYKILLYEAREKNKINFNKLDIKNVIKHDVDYIIPSSFYLKNINQYIMKGQIITLDSKTNPHRKIIKAYEKIASELLEQVKYEK